MKRFCFPVVMVLSLLLNVGVIGAVGYHVLHTGKLPELIGAPEHASLAEYLALDEQQRRLWREKEVEFMRGLNAAWLEIRDHRESMIKEIFAPSPDLAFIEAKRAAISMLQERQQRQVIDQLMEERNMLKPEQRVALARLLIRQNPVGSLEEVLSKKLHDE